MALSHFNFAHLHTCVLEAIHIKALFKNIKRMQQLKTVTTYNQPVAIENHNESQPFI